MKIGKQLNVTRAYVRGIRLAGNPKLVAIPQKKGTTMVASAAAVQLYERVRAAGKAGITVVELTLDSRYHYWLTRAMVKAKLVTPQGRAA
jgi:hypothetical protein